MSAHLIGVRAERPRGARHRRGGAALRRSAELALLDELRISAWDRVLFLECGDGWVAEEACRRMAKGYVCGLDRSSQLVALATRLRGIIGKLEFQPWDGRCVPHPDGCFDSVVAQRDIRGWSEPVSLLREMRRVARPGGRIYLVEARGRVRPASANCEWAQLFEQAGFPPYDRGAASRSLGVA